MASDEGSVDGSAERLSGSFVVLESVPSSTSSPTAAPKSAGQKNTIRLRQSTNPDELIEVLGRVWRPNEETELNLPACGRQGVVHDLDVSELIFFSKEVCNKLITFTVSRATDLEHKSKAIDVLTWFCTHTVLLETPFHEPLVVCRWLYSLVLSPDSAVSVAGLRGLANLVMHKSYHKAVASTCKASELLKGIGLDEGHRLQAMMYMYKLWTRLDNKQRIKIEVRIPRMHSWLIKMSLSPEERYQAAGILQQIIIESSNRDQLIESVLATERTSGVSAFEDDRLLSKRVSFYLTLPARDLTPTGWVTNKKFIAEIFRRLRDHAALRPVKELELLSRIVADKPDYVYDALMAENNWETLQTILECGNEVCQQLVVWLLAAMRTLSLSQKADCLPLQDHGVSFVKLLLQRINTTTIRALDFIWSRYQDAPQTFKEASVFSSLLDLLVDKHATLTEGPSKTIKRLLRSIFEDTACPQIMDMRSHVAGEFCGFLEKRKLDRKTRGRTLVLVFEILDADKLSPWTRNWLSDTGLAAIFSFKQCIDEYRCQITKGPELARLLRAAFEGNGAQFLKSTLCKTAFDACGVHSVLRFVFEEGRILSTIKDNPDVGFPQGLSLSYYSLGELRALLLKATTSSASQEWRQFLIWVTQKVGFNCRKTDQYIRKQCKSPEIGFFALLLKYDFKENDDFMAKVALQGAAKLNLEEAEDSWSNMSNRTEAGSLLWDLFIKHRHAINFTQDEWSNLLSFLKTAASKLE